MTAKKPAKTTTAKKPVAKSTTTKKASAGTRGGKRLPPAGSAASAYLRDDVIAMKAYTPGEQVNECIKLNTNECAWGPSPKVAAALGQAGGQAAANSLRLYPSPMGDKLRAAAAEVYGVDAAQVMIGNGSDDCLTVIMRSFLRPGDKVACPWPTYSLYDTLASIQGVEIAHYDWLEAPDAAVPAGSGGVADWHLPVSALAASGAKVVFVASPNNPSATLVPVQALETLARSLPGVLVVDEAYIDYACNGDGMAASFIPKLKDFPNVLVLRTFSKSYAMAGARLGLTFSDAEVINHMNKVKDSYNVNALTQLAGEAALRDRGHFAWLVKETIAQREVLAAAFKEFGWTWPETSGNFMLVETGSVLLAGGLYAKLKEAGILVRYWGNRPDLSSKLRITVGAKESNEKFITLTRKLLAELPR